MQKSEVIEAIQSERAHLDSLLASMSAEQMCQRVLSGQRSVKDILAHIADWERRCTGWIESGLRGETPERPEQGYEWKDIDALNERIFIENKDRPLHDVQVDSRHAYEQFLGQVQSLSDEDLNDPTRFAWTQGEPLIPYIAANSYEHYREHAEQIHAWLVDETLQA